MRKRFLVELLSLVVALIALLSPGSARADEPDHVRFRGGGGAEGGAWISTAGGAPLGLFGARGEIGVQFNHLVGVYAAPSAEAVFGKVGGLSYEGAALVDFTFGEVFTVGAGPELGNFAAFRFAKSGDNSSITTGSLYGGRLHLSFYTSIDKGEDGVRRKAIALGVDCRFLTGGARTTFTGTEVITTPSTGFIVAPMAMIEYRAF